MVGGPQAGCLGDTSPGGLQLNGLGNEAKTESALQESGTPGWRGLCRDKPRLGHRTSESAENGLKPR